jgi:hypothetical protein
MGTGVRGHTYQVGAETCSNCHRDMVHKSHERTTLAQEVERLKAVNPETLSIHVSELEIERDQLQEALQANRRVFPYIVVVTFILGASLGFAIPRLRRRK